MKGFLFDQNLPTKIYFHPSLPVHHVTEISANPTDTEIWDHARRNCLVIVSKDADFYHRIIDRQPPPWVVHLKIGNMRRNAFHTLLANAWPKIEMAIKHHKLVALYQDHIASVS